MTSAAARKQGDKPWKLRGLARRVALFVGAASLAGAVLAAGIDLYSQVGWDSPALQAWTLLPQTASAAGLLFLGYRRNSKAFYVLGALLTLIVIEEAFHVLNPVADWLSSFTTWALVYALVAAAGLVALAIAYQHISVEQRPIVRNLAVLLLLGGFFGGPLSVIGHRTNQLRWLFLEEFGEAVAFAIISGYVVGLVVQFGARS